MDPKWAIELEVDVSRSLSTWVNNGKAYDNGDDQSKLFIRWDNNYRNTGKTRSDFVWVQEHKITGDAKIDSKRVTRGRLPAQVIMFFTVFEPKVTGKRKEDRVRYQCAYVETLIVDNKGAVDPTHGMMTI